MEKLKNNKKLIIAFILGIIATLGISYALFTTMIIGEGKELTIDTNELKVIFTDTNVISALNVEPGWSITKTFSVENKTNYNYRYDIGIKDIVNTIVTDGNLQYKITSSNGLNMSEYKDIPKSSVAANVVLENNVEILANDKQEYTIEFIYKEAGYDQSIDMGKHFNGYLSITEGTVIASRCESNLGTIECKVLTDNPTIMERTNFSLALTETNTGRLYKTNRTEDNSTVYYFAGDARNNWLVFGQETKNGIVYDICWRIIRTNEDVEGNGLRLLYSGTYDSVKEECGNTTAGYVGSEVTYGSNGGKNVGYMRSEGTLLEEHRQNTSNSSAKNTTDNWYKKTTMCTADTDGNCTSSLSNKVNEKAIYCNDRSINSGTYAEGQIFDFGANGRINKNNPSLKCGANAGDSLYVTYSNKDKFSADKTEGESKVGNGDLTYPVALITADEIKFAGSNGWYYLNKNFYDGTANCSILNNKKMWTMTPRNISSSYGLTHFYVADSNLTTTYIYYGAYIRPVLSLNSNVLYSSGDGSFSNPYRVQ